MITLTLIRHGESEDNLQSKWSRRDTPLTALGERQADALGTAFNATSTRFQHLYASDLQRAHSTALIVLKHHTDPKPGLEVTEKLREKDYGVAEGTPWIPLLPEGTTIEKCFAEGIFPKLYGRDERFPGGESLDDLAQRAKDSLKEYVLPRVFDKSQDGAHIGFICHGIFMCEMMPVLQSLDPDIKDIKYYGGHFNTAWNRIEISVKDGYAGEYDLNSPPPLHVRIIAFNNHEHLDTPPFAPVNEEVKASF